MLGVGAAPFSLLPENGIAAAWTPALRVTPRAERFGHNLPGDLSDGFKHPSLGGSIATVNTSGASLATTFTGVGIVLVAATGTGYGIARVAVDGETPRV